MEIQGPGNLQGPRRIQGKKVTGPSDLSQLAGGRSADSVELSQKAQLLDRLQKVAPVRYEKVQEIKRLIQRGEYETPEKLEKAVDKLLEELL